MPANTTDIQQLLINEANRIGPDIYRKTLNTSPWLKLVKKDVWPDEMGDTINVLTYERSLPANALSWTQVAINAVDTNAWSGNGTTAGTSSTATNAIPSASTVSFAQTLRSYNLKHTAIESPRLSVNDLRFSLKRKEQLSNIFAILQDNTSYAWQNRYRDEFVRVAQNKIMALADTNGNLVQQAAADGTVFDGGTFSSGTPVVASTSGLPTSILTQGILDRVYMKLIRDGAGNNPLDRENSRPVFGAILSSEASRNLIMSSADVRQDYRWSDSKNELLAPLGIQRSYAGYFHMVDDWLPRHDALLITATSGATVTVTVQGSANAVAAGDVVSFRNGTSYAVSSVGSISSGSQVLTFASSSVVTASGAAANAVAFVRRMPYARVNATQGVRYDISVAYEQAQYEDTVIFHQDVFTNLVPKPITAAGSNVTFDPVSYMGEFKFRNILNETTNPDGTLGYFRAVLSAGTKPIRPEWGYVVRHLRASTPLLLTGVTKGGANIVPTFSATSFTSGGIASA